MKNSWPRLEPLTGRFVCEFCWNHDHKRCTQHKPDTLKQECRCACHDPKPPRKKGEKSENLDIGEVYGNIEV